RRRHRLVIMRRLDGGGWLAIMTPLRTTHSAEKRALGEWPWKGPGDLNESSCESLRGHPDHSHHGLSGCLRHALPAPPGLAELVRQAEGALQELRAVCRQGD